MQKALDFLKECGTFFIASIDDDQARVRPFGALNNFEDKLYICTNNTKKVFKQMVANPKIEICALNKDMKWIRIHGEVAVDPRPEAKEAMLATSENLRKMYKVDDGIFEVLYFKSGKAEICAFAGVEEEIEL